MPRLKLRADTIHNIRYKCPYCSKGDLLFKSYGKHIYNHHADKLFAEGGDAKENLGYLHRPKYQVEPLTLQCNGVPHYSCLGCLTFYKTLESARKHFTEKKTCRDDHKTQVINLYNDYPKDTKIQSSTASMKNKGFLEAMIGNLLERVRMYETQTKAEDIFNYKSYLDKFYNDWGLDIQEDVLKESWDTPDEQEEEEEEEQEKEQEEEEEAPMPLLQERALTQEEVFRKVFQTKDELQEIFTSVATGEKKEIPNEFKSLYSKPRVEQKTPANPIPSYANFVSAPPPAYPNILSSTKRSVK